MNLNFLAEPLFKQHIVGGCERAAPGGACDEAAVTLRTVLSQTLVCHFPLRLGWAEERKPKGVRVRAGSDLRVGR